MALAGPCPLLISPRCSVHRPSCLPPFLILFQQDLFRRSLSQCLQTLSKGLCQADIIMAAFLLIIERVSQLHVVRRFHVASSTLSDRIASRHPARLVNGPQHLSMEQEDALLNKINAYAARGGYVTQLAQTLSDEPLGRNWTTSFIRRHKDVISSQFLQTQHQTDRPSMHYYAI